LLSTYATLIYALCLQDIKSAKILSLYVCVQLLYLGDGATDRSGILRDGRYGSPRSFALWGYLQEAPKSQILTANISKKVSRSVTCQMGLARREL